MPFAAFARRFGKPRAGSASSLKSLRLNDSSALALFSGTVGCGVFADGLISVASIRESAARDLGAWRGHLPADARPFASTAFGTFFFLDTRHVWVLETQYGILTEATLSIDEILAALAGGELDDRLRSGLFSQWHALGGDLSSHCVLCPRPAIALGGEWRADALGVVPVPVYLHFTGGIFADAEPNAVVIQRASDA
jgi:hypothetical protein